MAAEDEDIFLYHHTCEDDFLLGKYDSSSSTIINIISYTWYEQVMLTTLYYDWFEFQAFKQSHKKKL